MLCETHCSRPFYTLGTCRNNRMPTKMGVNVSGKTPPKTTEVTECINKFPGNLFMGILRWRRRIIHSKVRDTLIDRILESCYGFKPLKVRSKTD